MERDIIKLWRNCGAGYYKLVEKVAQLCYVQKCRLGRVWHISIRIIVLSIVGAGYAFTYDVMMLLLLVMLRLMIMDGADGNIQ